MNLHKLQEAVSLNLSLHVDFVDVSQTLSLPWGSLGFQVFQLSDLLDGT